MNRLLFILGLIGAAIAQAGSVRTLDGKSYEGELQLAGGDGVAIATRSGAVNVSFVQLLQANFKGGGDASQWTVDGSAQQVSGVFDLRGPCVVHRPMTGDGDVSVRVVGVQGNGAKAGILMRDSPQSETANAAVLVDTTGAVWIVRRAQHGAALESMPQEKVALPCWLRLTRQARRFTAFKSDDGRNWEPVGNGVGAEIGEQALVALTTTAGAARFDQVSVSGATPTRGGAPRLIQGVLLRSGASIAGKIETASEASLKLSTAAGKTIDLPMAQITRLVFGPIAERSVPAGRSGVVLANGDFADGQFKGIEAGKVKLSSVLFGLMSLEIGKEASAVVVSEVGRSSSAFVVRAMDGSVYAADALRSENGQLIVGDTPLPLSQIYQIRRGAGVFESLVDLSGPAVDPTAAGVDVELRAADVDRFIPIRGGGGEGTYALGGAYKSFLCTIGVPATIVPSARVRFVVVGDGVELYRSAELTSVDDAVTVAVNITGRAQLTLRVEADSPIGALGIWGDPLLVRK